MLPKTQHQGREQEEIPQDPYSVISCQCLTLTKSSWWLASKGAQITVFSEDSLLGRIMDLGGQRISSTPPSHRWGSLASMSPDEGKCISPMMNCLLFPSPLGTDPGMWPTTSPCRGPQKTLTHALHVIFTFSNSTYHIDEHFVTYNIYYIPPGWCGSVDWALACEPKGRWFNPQSGHMPGLQPRSPVNRLRQPMMFLSHINVSLPLFLPPF